jgi:hypothetical protein
MSAGCVLIAVSKVFIQFVVRTCRPACKLALLISVAPRWPAFVTLLAILNPVIGQTKEAVSDSEKFHWAVDFCRAQVARPIALSVDERLLCFDGWIEDGMDLSLVRDLKEFGLFVVRSLGGNEATAVALSRLLRDRHATIVIYDFCISACANSFFIASDQTYVTAGALVAWRNQASVFAGCTSFATPGSQDIRAVEPPRCPPFKDVTKYNDVSSDVTDFFSERTVGPIFQPPPASAHVKRIVKALYDETGVYVNIGWTLSPRYHAAFKTMIVYESYPQSQAEVDAMAVRLGLGRVIYDP